MRSETAVARGSLWETGSPRVVGVVGSRSLGYQHASQVGAVSEDLLGRGYHLATGGAMGADEFVVSHLLHTGHSDRCTVYAAWREYAGFPVKVRAMMRQFKQYGGHVVWGQAGKKEAPHMVKIALLMRNQRLVEACYGLVAFLAPSSRGTMFSIKRAATRKVPLVVFPNTMSSGEIDPGTLAALQEVPAVKWVPLRCGGCWEGGYKAVYLR